MAIGRADGTGPRPLAPVESTRALTALGDTRQENNARLARLDVGRQYLAQIISRLSDGSFAVRIADTTARLALPDGGKPGDKLALTLLATEPRPTFNLDEHQASPAGTRAGSAAGANAATSAAATARLAQALASASALPGAVADGADTAAPATLSDIGKLAAALAKASGNGTAALVGNVPVAAAGAAAPQLASALHDTLTFSGLFYESHVQQWASGERALGDLLREPQARGSAAASTGAPAGAAAADLGPASMEVLEAKRNLLAYAATASLPVAAGADGVGTLDSAAAQMIGLQLQTLEHQRVQWQGELWPGQPMGWEVRRGDADGGPARPDGAPQQEAWQSVVRFTLPGLGTVAATLDLTGDRVRIQVRTDSDATTKVLRTNAPALASALDVAGTTLENLQIRRDTDPPDSVAGGTVGSTP